ncbi:ABC transporter permease subunit [Halorhabdus amylolytica]|uniref:ABC transporter permease subunit n=1 Tax=Halorhabdus amylolytica TaxID=2559573 RepID=UPI0010AABCEB|nr:ABC transporter permease subunit [Halorhabdus amylolytica]
MRRGARIALIIAQRAFDSVTRSRALLALATGYTFAILGFAWASRGGGYLALSMNLLTPLEVLVPLVAVAVGYRSILDDRLRGELDVLGSYPLAGRTYVLGTFLGRAAALLVVVVVPLVIAMGTVLLFRIERISVLATHATADSPIVYLRMVVLTAAFALVALAIAIGISALSASSRGGLAVAVVTALALVIGLDLGVVAGLAADVVPADVLDVLLAASPLSAYRGLVFELAVGSVAPRAVSGGIDPVAACGSLTLWAVGSLSIAADTVFR